MKFGVKKWIWKIELARKIWRCEWRIEGDSQRHFHFIFFFDIVRQVIEKLKEKSHTLQFVAFSKSHTRKEKKKTNDRSKKFSYTFSRVDYRFEPILLDGEYGR